MTTIPSLPPGPSLSRKSFLGLAGASLIAACSSTQSKTACLSDGSSGLPSPPMPLDLVRGLHKTHLSEVQMKVLARGGLKLVIGDRLGAKVTDAYTGEEYWDCHRLGSTYNLGHRHPDVLAALREGLDQIAIGSFMLLSQYRSDTARRLSETTQGALPATVFTASGAEANETAMKAARVFTKRRKIVCFEGGYHGDTLMTLAVGGDDQKIGLYGLEDMDVVRVPFNDLDALRDAVDTETAALIGEPTVAQLGFIEPEAGFWKAASDHCRSVGALVILDEVQTGGGATGTFWHYQQLDFTPDILVSGKWPSGGLYPNSFAIMRQEVHDVYCEGIFMPHPSTFGGSELGCLVTSTVIDLLSDDALLENVVSRTAQIRNGLKDLPIELRANGLCMAIVDKRRSNFENVQRLINNGILAIPALHDPHAVEFRPVLTITREETDDIIRRVRLALI